MKIFTVGPVAVYPCISKAYTEDIPYFRTDVYSHVVNENLSRLKAYLHASADTQLLYFAASGTGAMEATIDNLLTAKDKALVINGGLFGYRFCELLAHYQIPYDEIKLEWNEALTAEHLERYDGKGYTALLVNLHETSTGQFYDVRMLAEFCRCNDLLFIVDAISTFMADPYYMESNEIDVTIFSSQKGLCLSPGAAFVALSPRAQTRVKEKTSSYYFNFSEYLRNISRGQTPFTPAVNIMYELHHMLAYIESTGGIDVWCDSVKQKAIYFRKRAEECGLSICQHFPLSNMLTPILTKDGDAYAVFKALEQDHAIYVNPCGGALASQMLRIAHVGSNSLSDFDELLNKLNFVLTSLRRNNK